METRLVSSNLVVSIIFKFWAVDITAFRESLARKGFAMASTGIVQQGGIVATVEAGPLAYKGGAELSYNPNARQLALKIVNSKAPQENLNEVISALDQSGVRLEEIADQVNIAGQVLVSSTEMPAAIIQRAVSKDVGVKLKKIFGGREVIPIGIRVASANSPTEIFEKPHFNLLIEPLLTDMSKFLVAVNYLGKDLSDAIVFLQGLFANIDAVIKSF